MIINKILNYLFPTKQLCIDLMLSRIVVLYYVANITFTIFKRVFGSSLLFTVVIGFLSFLPVIIYVLKSSKKIFNARSIALFLIATLVYLLTFFRGILTSKIILYYFRTIIGITLLSSILAIKDLTVLKKCFFNHVYVVFLISIFVILVNKSEVSYMMQFSYLLLPFVCIMSIRFFSEKEKKFIHLLMIFIELILMFSYGSRGPLLCYAVFLLLYFLVAGKSLIAKIVLLVTLALIITNLTQILNFIGNTFISFGIESRTIDLITSGSILYGSGRDEIYSLIVSKINERPLIGWGPMGEYLFIDEYAHNIVLEILFDFGIVMGGIVLLLIFLPIVFSFFNTKKELLPFFIAVLSYGVVSLFFSGSYLIEDSFYVFLALLFHKARYKNFRSLSVNQSQSKAFLANNQFN